MNPTAGCGAPRARRARVAVAVVVTILASRLVTPPPVAAETTSRSAVETAIERGRAGRRDFDGGRYEAALAAFREANALAYSPVFALYEARSLRTLRRTAEAIAGLEALLGAPLPAEAPAQWLDAREAAVRELGELREASAATTATAEAPSVALSLPGTTARKAISAPPPIQASTRPMAEDDQRRRYAPYTWTALGVGAAGVVAGAISGGLVWSEARALDNACPERQDCSPALQDRQRRAERLATVSDVAWVVGGAGIATAAVLFLLQRSSDGPTTSTGMTFQAYPGGLVFSSRF